MSRLECIAVDDGVAEASVVLLDPRPFRPFKSSEEYLYAMKEDLAEWLQRLYPHLDIDVDNFMQRLDDGVALCKHANNVRRTAMAHAEKLEQRGRRRRRFSAHWDIPDRDILYKPEVKPGSFFARDNVHNFITWCRLLGIYECLLFETDDLVLRKNEKSFILCLLEVARRGAKFGMPAPLLVQFEKEIDRELAKDQQGQQNELEAESGQNDDHLSDEEDEEDEELMIEYGPIAQIVTNDLRSLDEMVRDLVEFCTCPTQFPMIRVSEGKYRIGDTKMLIFVRVLRNHVMVRVGGGWDTLAHYLEKHDPCRCRAGHRATIASKLSVSQNSRGNTQMAVTYERSTSSPPSSRRSSGASTGYPAYQGSSSRKGSLVPASPARVRQRSPSPSTRLNANRSQSPHGYGSNFIRSGSGRFGYGGTGAGYSTPATSPAAQPPTGHQQMNNLDSLESYDSGVGGFGHASPGTRRRSSAGRGHRSPEEALTATADAANSGDSSSEVSDEGYRTGGIVAKGEAELEEERPDSSCTQVSQASSGESGVSIETGQRRRSQETRSRIPMLAAGTQQKTGKTVQFQKQVEHQPPATRRSVSRSNSVSSETGGNAFQRDTFGRHSLRSKNGGLSSTELERLNRPRVSLGSQPTPKYSTSTWNGRNNRRERPAINEMFQSPGTRGRPVQTNRAVSRATSSSPHSRRRYFGPSVTSTPVSPETARPRATPGTPEIVPMIRDMLTTDGDSDDSILKKLEDIINQYKARVENLAAEGQPSSGRTDDYVDDKTPDRARMADRRGSLDASFSPIPVRTARRDSSAHSPSKIPMPLFYRQKQQETCL